MASSLVHGVSIPAIHLFKRSSRKAQYHSCSLNHSKAGCDDLWLLQFKQQATKLVAWVSPPFERGIIWSNVALRPRSSLQYAHRPYHAAIIVLRKRCLVVFLVTSSVPSMWWSTGSRYGLDWMYVQRTPNSSHLMASPAAPTLSLRHLASNGGWSVLLNT